MKKSLLALAAIAALICPLQADDDKVVAQPSDKSVVEAALTKGTLHRIDGKAFKEAELKKSPEYFILYYSSSY